MRYYDTTTGTLRIKRRYLWSFWMGVIFFIIGVAIGALLIR